MALTAEQLRQVAELVNAPVEVPPEEYKLHPIVADLMGKRKLKQEGRYHGE
jgi:hypothetical protein